MDRIAMVVFSHFPTDPRVRREANAVLDAGYPLDLVCLNNNRDSKKYTNNFLNVFRIHISRKRGSLFRYGIEYFSFIIAAGFKLAMLHLKNKFKVVHIHNIPDVLVFSAILPKLMGSKIILDMHEIMPEFFMMKYGLPENHIMIRILKLFEKISIKMADHVIVATPFLEKTIKQRATDKDKVTTILNLPDPKIFITTNRPAKSEGDPFKIIYPGTLNRLHGVDIAIKAIQHVVHTEKIPMELHIYGSGSNEERRTLYDLTKSLQIEKYIVFRDLVSQEELARTIESMDVGIVPKRDGIFIGEALSSKLFEFAALGVPAIVAKTSGDSYYFDDSMVLFFQPENVQDLSKKIVLMYKHPWLRAKYSVNAKRFFQSINWDIMKRDYYGVYKKLLLAKQ